MVDELGQYPPPPEKDIHWDMVVPAELPYTIAAAPFRGEHAEASAESLKVPIELQQTEGLVGLARRIGFSVPGFPITEGLDCVFCAKH